LEPADGCHRLDTLARRCEAVEEVEAGDRGDDEDEIEHLCLAARLEPLGAEHGIGEVGEGEDREDEADDLV
jgi:hypothetical protein